MDRVNEVWLTAIALLEVDPADTAAVDAVTEIDVKTLAALPAVLKELFSMLAQEVDPDVVARVLGEARARALAGEFRGVFDDEAD